MRSNTTSILEFVGSLRGAGLTIGLAEAMAAMEAMHCVDLSDRDAVRFALAACLCKSEGDRERFDKAFDAFFVGEQVHSTRRTHAARQEQARQEKLEESARELTFQDAPLDLSEHQLEVYANMEPQEKEKLVQFLEKTSTGKNVTPKFRFVAEQVVRSKLNRAGRSQQAGEGETDLLHKSIAAISEEELPQVQRLIEALVRRLNGSISRKAKRTGRRESIDLKKTIHKSLHTGGTLFTVAFKRRRRRKQRLLMLCDVSASMYRFSGFALQFIYGMNLSADKSQSFLFSEGVEPLRGEDLTSMQVFEKRVTGSALWNKGTNIARALDFLLSEAGAQTGAASVAMIVSDAKTLETQRACDLLGELRAGVKKIVWLNPVPEREWESLPWVACFREHCTMLDCSTVERLAEACAKADDILS